MDIEHEDPASREHAWLAAILAKDLDLLESFLAEEFVYTASNHGRRTRQEWLDSIADYQFSQLQLLETDVTSYGDVALVHARIRQDATLAGQVRVGVFLITDVLGQAGSTLAGGVPDIDIRVVATSSVGDQVLSAASVAMLPTKRNNRRDLSLAGAARGRRTRSLAARPRSRRATR